MHACQEMNDTTSPPTGIRGVAVAELLTNWDMLISVKSSPTLISPVLFHPIVVVLPPIVHTDLVRISRQIFVIHRKLFLMRS